MKSFVVVVIFLHFGLIEPQGQGHRVNGPCQSQEETGSGTGNGTCRLLRNCPSALSNLYSGVNPTLCKVQIQGRAVVCCPNGPRISEIKCEEYKKLLMENVYSAVPFLPLEALEEVDYGAKEVKCSALSRGIGFIVGGRNARQEEFPHMVGLGYGQNVSSLAFQCGGALISEFFVVTAAHCTPPNSPPTYVMVGDVHLNPNISDEPRRQVRKITEIHIHPNYKRPKKYNDIALLRLATRVTFSQAVRPACLPQPKLRPENTESTTATGWGRVGFGEQSEVLQAVNLTRYTLAECNTYYNNPAERRLRYPEGIIRTQMCVGERNGGKDTCQGDSGGPLVVSDRRIPCLYYVVGLTSFGALVCGYQPGVYTNVQSFIPWIENIVWPK